jgi:hypothetical protein
MPKEFVVDDSQNLNTITKNLANFQKEILSEIKLISGEIVEDEFGYIKTTIENQHHKKYNVLMQKTDDGWVIFPDQHDMAVQEEFGLNFPIWRKLYSQYKMAERK